MGLSEGLQGGGGQSKARSTHAQHSSLMMLYNMFFNMLLATNWRVCYSTVLSSVPVVLALLLLVLLLLLLLMLLLLLALLLDDLSQLVLADLNHLPGGETDRQTRTAAQRTAATSKQGVVSHWCW